MRRISYMEETVAIARLALFASELVLEPTFQI